MSNLVTESDARRVLKYIRRWRPRLGLHEWSITLYATHVDHYQGDEVFAEATVTPSILHAQIVVIFGRKKDDTWDAEGIAIHELLHVLLAEYDHEMKLALKHIENSALREDLDGRLWRENEQVVMRLEKIICRLASK